ncbi:matrix protein [Rhinolophus rhabdovirus DPuer]|nr:matrix protein [Rhinolophus rhabdovirus DPuer]
MLRLWKKKPKAQLSTELEVRQETHDPFVPSAPSTVSGKRAIYLQTLRVQASIEIRTREAIRSFDDCLKILEPWIDEARCPIWQAPLDSWVFYCVGAHARRDPGCEFDCRYRAQIDQVLEFKHDIKELMGTRCLPIDIKYDTVHLGQPCEVRFTNRMTDSKRKGVPFHVLFLAPLKDKNPPKDMMSWPINLTIKLEVEEDDENPFITAA